MTIDYLARNKVISVDLFRSLKKYHVKTLDQALSFLNCGLISLGQREELERIQYDIEQNISFFKKLPLSGLYLKGLISTRLYNCLQDSGFTIFSQVIHYIESNGGDCSIFLKQRKFGQKCLTEITDILYYLRQSEFKHNEPEIASTIELVPALTSNCDFKEGDKITISTTIEYLRGVNLISVRTYNCLDYAELTTIGDIINYINATGSVDRLLSIRNFGRKSLQELQNILSLVEDVNGNNSQSPNIEDGDAISSMDVFVNNYNELMVNDVYRASIDYYYECNKAKLSARSIHALEENFTSIIEVACLYFTGLKSVDLRYCGKKTYDELSSFIISLYIYISSLFTINYKNVEKSLIGRVYSFLQEDEIDFVMDFKERMTHFPMFYILYNYLIRSNSRFERIFCRYYGVKGEPETLKDISVSYNLTFERCRQLLSRKNIQDTSLITTKNWELYDFLDNVLFYNNFDYKSILYEEGLGHLSKFTFWGLCSLIKDIRICKIGRSDSTSYKEYYISGILDDCFDLKNSIKDIESTLNKRCTEDVKLPISAFIDSYWLKEPSFDKSKVEDILIYIITEDYGVELSEDKILYLQQNAIDRSGEIYKIIEEYGKPMHINLIRETLISRYPDDLLDLTIEQVRSDMYRHPHIKSLGKLSTYAIDKWELYTGTIRDLLYDILSVENDPMHIEELYNEVSLIYSNTSIKSITSSMVSDNLQRFVRFVGSYYGVTGKIYNEEYVVWDAEAFSRKNFDERIKEFEAFLKSHHHLPRYSDDNEEEAALCRWYKRVKASDASITSEQQQRLSDLLDRNNDYLVTTTEYSFYRYCEEFKAFVEDNIEFPTLETDSAKYSWFMKNKRIYTEFEDRRRTYFEDLIEFLYAYGFEV